jgi:hypothetical protein
VIDKKIQIEKKTWKRSRDYEFEGNQIISSDKLALSYPKFNCNWSDESISCSHESISKLKGKDTKKDSYLFINRLNGTVNEWTSYLDPSLTKSERILETVDQDTLYFEGKCQKIEKKF